MFTAVCISRVWAGDEPPTVESNKNLIDKTVGLRVSPEEELEGLDVTEHGGNAYPDFEVYSYGSMGSGGGSAAAAVAGSPGQVDLEPVK